MRSPRGRSALAGLVLGFAAAGVAVLVATTGAGAASVPERTARETATEACEAMVQEAVVAVAGQPLVTPPAGSWAGRVYTCTYDLGADGRLILRVDVLKDDARARAAFRETRRASDVDERLNGIGQQAFQATDGTVVARKDRFVLTVDPSQVTARLDPGDLSFTAATAVLTCWTGEES